MENYGVLNYLDMSTGHIPENVLNNQNCLWHLASYEEGAFFVVPEKDDPFLKSQKIPETLNTIFQFARERNCTLIRFDRDGFEYPELPTYDW